MNQINHVKKFRSDELRRDVVNKAAVLDELKLNRLHSVRCVDEECTAERTLKTPEKRVSMEYEFTETQATHNKSLHPATPSQIKFDFDEDGLYSSDGTK